MQAQANSKPHSGQPSPMDSLFIVSGRLEELNKLGEGGFGVVLSGRYKHPNGQVLEVGGCVLCVEDVLD